MMLRIAKNFWLIFLLHFSGVCGVRNATLIVNLPANVERAAVSVVCIFVALLFVLS